MKSDANDKARAFAQAISKISMKKLFLQAVKATEDLALDLNRSQLYDEGEDALGKSLGEYKPMTVRIKKSKGQRTDHITLSDTFKFYDRMFINARDIPILIDSKDVKTPMLEEKYGEILGLNRENTKIYKDAVMLETKKLLHQTIESKKEILQ